MLHDLRSLAAAAALTLAACGSTQALLVPDAPEFAQDGTRTYAWVESAPAETRHGEPVTNQDVISSLRTEIDKHLAGAGYELADAAAADLELALFVGLTQETREKDPFYSFYRVERLEFGHATLSVMSADRGDLLWTRHATSQLRIMDRGFGHTTVQYVGSDEPQRWRIGLLAREVTMGLP